MNKLMLAVKRWRLLHNNAALLLAFIVGAILGILLVMSFPSTSAAGENHRDDVSCYRIAFCANTESLRPIEVKPITPRGEDRRSLGNLNMNSYDPDSIYNEYGAGNEYDPDSIFNQYGAGNPYNGINNPYDVHSDYEIFGP